MDDTNNIQNMDEQLEPAHKMVDAMHRAKKKSCVTLLRYNVDKLEISLAQVPLFAKENEDEKSQQIVYVTYKLEELNYLLDLLSYVYDKAKTIKPTCNVLQKIITTMSSWLFFFLKSGWVERSETYFSP